MSPKCNEATYATLLLMLLKFMILYNKQGFTTELKKQQ